jgi:hypothetical protein
MPAPVAPAPVEGQAPAQVAGIPFVVGSNHYSEAPLDTTSKLLDANATEVVKNITPGGFLRGIVLQLSSSGGVIGTGVLAADAPWSVISSVSIEDISGGPILYPMGGFAAMCVQKYLRPWDGDPAKRPDFSNTINPAFTLRIMVELRETVGVLANTDARAQYRLRYTIAALNPGLLSTTGTATAPTVTVKSSILIWSQPDLQDLLGNPIVPIPDGLQVSRFLMHELPAVAVGNNVIRHTLMGNEIRGILWIFRTSANARINLTDANAGAIDFRLDNRRLWKQNPSQLVEEMYSYYDFLKDGTSTRDTGVYAIPRFRDPGDLLGEYWLQTVEQSLLQMEFSGTDVGANGSVEIVYDELAVAGALSPQLEGV